MIAALKRKMWRAALGLLVGLVFVTSPQVASAKEVLVLLPIQVDNSLEAEASLFGTALQQGLGRGFEVFFGPAVEEKLEVEYAKEGCTAESCAQNLAIAFNGELIGDTSIQKLEDSFVVQVQINNIVTGQIADSMIEICSGCSKLQLIQFVRAVGSKLANKQLGSSTASLDFMAPQAPANNGKQLEISTGSFDTEIFVNGERVGRGPTKTSYYYDMGSRVSILLKTPGYRDIEFDHIVGRDDQRLKNISLVTNTAVLKINSQPRNSEVSVDGKKIGRTPVSTPPYAIGTAVNITIQKKGFTAKQIRHIVGEMDSRLASIKLDVEKRKLYVDTSPRGAQIYVANRYVGTTPIEIGPYEDGERVNIRLERDGYQPEKIRHRVGRRDDSLANVELSEKGAASPSSRGQSIPMGF